MRLKKLTLLSVLGISAFSMALLSPILISAQSANNKSTDFVSRLAGKLELSTDQVQSAVDEVHAEFKAERSAEISAQIEQLVTSGDLTQRQADLFNAMQEIRINQDVEKVDLQSIQGLTDEEKRAQMQAQREEKKAQMLSALNNKGLETTQEEIDSLYKTLQDLNIPIGKGLGRGKIGLGFRPS